MCGCCGSSEKDESDSPEVKAPNPLRNRSCTDIPFLILFILFVIGMIFVTAFAIINGSAFRLMNGYDSYGDICGSTNEKLPNITKSGKDLSEKPYVLYMNILYPRSSLSICVKECPNVEMDTNQQYYEYSRDTKNMICNYDLDLEDYKTADKRDKGPCPTKVFASEPIFNRCLPANLRNLTMDIQQTIVGYLNNFSMIQKALIDLYKTWRVILCMCFAAVGIAGVMVVIIRYLAAFIVWVVFVLGAIASVVGTAVLWWTFAEYNNKVEDDREMQIPILDVTVNNRDAFLAFAIIATVLTVILLLIMFVMRKRVALTVALFKEAGSAIGSMPLILFQPLWTFLILIIFFVYWIIVMIAISSAGEPVLQKKTGFVVFEETTAIQSMWWFWAIALIWISEFILACQELVIAGAIATWYFTRNKKELSCIIGKATCRTISHHLGSAALGAFIITLVKFPRMILMYLQKKFKNSENQVAQFCLKCCICCLWCLEKCLKFLNRNAYIVIAIDGSNFCSAARRAFLTLIENALRVAAINSVGDFVLFLGKIAVMAATGAIGVLILRTRNDLNFYAVPVLVICVFAFFVAHCFLSIYEMVVDTLLLCFCEDCKINDGTPGKEYFMSASLMEYVKNSSEALDNLKKKKNKPKEGEGDKLHDEKDATTV